MQELSGVVHQIAVRGSGTSVVLGDQYPAIVDALARLMAENGIDVAGVATSAESLVEVTVRCRPDVVISDLSLPTPVGAAMLEELHERAPDSRILVFTSVADRQLAARLQEVGVSGVIPKDASLTELLRAVVLVANGGTYIDPSLAGATDASRPIAQLTPREIEVLQLLANGGSNRTAAEELHIAPDTVRSHVRNAMMKLRSETRVEAVATAMRRALIS